MATKPSKRREALLKAVDTTKTYSVDEAMGTLKNLKSAKFDETVEVALNLNVDPRHADQMIRGSVVLPNGTGKTVRVAVFAKDAKADEAYFKCKKIVREILPEMNLVIGEYTFDESKLIFYFTAENRLDFRELVKEVNKTFKKRVEFYQIKQNDEGRILSAFGKYGKEIYW